MEWNFDIRYTFVKQCLVDHYTDCLNYYEVANLKLTALEH